MNEKELAFLIIKDGLANQSTNSGVYTEINENPRLKSTGIHTIEGMLEYLHRMNIVQDFLSTFGEYGHGYAYRLNPAIIKNLSDDSFVLKKIDEIFEQQNRIPAALQDLIDEYKNFQINNLYKNDLIESLQELKICYGAEYYIACRALCEQIAGTALMKFLEDRKISVDYNKILKDPRFLKYFDQPLTEKAMIINKNRAASRKKISGVLPSRYQAAMEIQLIIETLKSISGQLEELQMMDDHCGTG